MKKTKTVIALVIALASITLSETALEKAIELALEALEGIAPKLSPGMVSWLEADTDLDPIREEPRFTKMMIEVKARFAKA